MIIGIYGKKGSGKDTFSDFICEKYNFTKYGFGDPIKNIASIIFGFSKEQLYGNKKEEIDPIWGIRPRDFFQKFGTDYAQFILPTHFPEIFDCGDNKRTIWVKVFEQWYINQKRTNPDLKVVINDVRFKHEYDIIKKLNGYVIKINREVLNTDNHISENELDNYDNNKFKYIIENNNSKQNLYNSIVNIIN
jgi:hypothetical protein